MVALSIIFGILSILTSILCIGGFFGILGVVFSISSFNRVGKNKLNTFGLATSIIGIILSLIMFVFILSLPDEDSSNVKNATEVTQEITTEITTEATTTITTEEKTSTESADVSATENTITPPVDIENAVSTLFDSTIDNSYKTSFYYCDISTPTEGDGKLVSIQVESDSFTDENVCTSFVVDIISSIFSSEDYQYVNSAEFYMLSSGQLNYLISLKNAQAINTASDITSYLEVTSFNDTAKTQSTDTTEPQVWIPSSGSKYHSKSSCSNMNNPRQVSKSEAENMGYTPCKRCY